MKRIVLFLAAFAMICANAFAEKVDEIEFANKGKFALGVTIGAPGLRSTHDDRAKMPSVNVDGNWGLSHGFINSRVFGKNGGVDLGFYHAICFYNKWDDSHHGFMQIPALVRAAFHFEFVKHLDVYAGLSSGLNLWFPTGSGWSGADKDNWNHVKYAGGMFTGCKWYFTDVFGVKAEFQFDWASPSYGNLPTAMAGVTFNFR